MARSSCLSFLPKLRPPSRSKALLQSIRTSSRLAGCTSVVMRSASANLQVSILTLFLVVPFISRPTFLTSLLLLEVSIPCACILSRGLEIISPFHNSPICSWQKPYTMCILISSCSACELPCYIFMPSSSEIEEHTYNAQGLEGLPTDMMGKVKTCSNLIHACRRRTFGVRSTV